MFESTGAYYETYVHALKVLQKPEIQNLQFNEQLVYLESSVQDVECNVDWCKVCENHCDSVDEIQEAAINQGIYSKLCHLRLFYHFSLVVYFLMQTFIVNMFNPHTVM